jgi:hypothetical protein
MTESDPTIDRKSDKKEPSILIYIISVSVSIVMIITISKLVFNLIPERSEFVYTEKVADETYKEFSQRLETISKEYIKEIKAKEKEG